MMAVVNLTCMTEKGPMEKNLLYSHVHSHNIIPLPPPNSLNVKEEKCLYYNFKGKWHQVEAY